MSKKADSKHDQYHEDVELWETKQLGASAEHAKPASAEDDKALDDDLGLAPISLRLQKEVVAKLKTWPSKKGWDTRRISVKYSPGMCAKSRHMLKREKARKRSDWA